MATLTLPSSIMLSQRESTVVVDPELHRPRYWPTVWLALRGANWSASTKRKKLSAIDAFYKNTVQGPVPAKIDEILYNLDLEAIEVHVTSFFMSLRNKTTQTGANTKQSWETVWSFVQDILSFLIDDVETEYRMHELRVQLVRLEQKCRNLAPAPPQSKTQTLRALPALVVEELYEIIDPASKNNPFRSERQAWRNFCLIITLLHQGLRTSEALMLPVGSVKTGLHPHTGRPIKWMNIQQSEDADPRTSDRPSLKTDASRRQIPVSEEIGSIINTYENNYRGRQAHPFLFVNSSGAPLSSRGVRYIFNAISQQLSSAAIQSLEDNMRSKKITAHDLRHTCAVIRISSFKEGEIDEAKALEKMRAYFGWSRTSDMPRLYARAYYETHLASVWNDTFDTHVETLRSIRNGFSE